MRDSFITFGTSVRGPGHQRAGLPNQDAYLTFSKDGRYGIALSDGLGSCALSDKGSKAVCCAVVATMDRTPASAAFDIDSFLEDIKSTYCASVDSDEYLKYLSTCLWCFYPGDGRIYAGMLGDGLVAIVKNDGSVIRMTDAKSDGFSNVVISLSPKTTREQWQTISLPVDTFKGVLLCSDGIADDLVDIDGFVTGFLEEYGTEDAPNDAITVMLEQWPVPLHSDDKTIICLSRRCA